MKFKIRFAQQIVGLFVLLAAVSILVIVVSMGANQRWFAKNYAYYSMFPSAQGLTVGMPITYKGFPVGKITDINLESRNEVRVDFYIQDTYLDLVIENSILQLMTSPIGIGGGLVFHQGRTTGPPLPEGTLIPALSSKEGQRIVDADLVILPANSDSITQMIAQVEPILKNVNTLLISVNQTLGTVNSALAGEDDGPLGETLAQVQSLLTEVEATLVAVSIEATSVLSNVDGITSNLEATTAELRDPTGLIPRLLDADGSIATILDDNNALYNQVEAMLASVNATLDEVNDFAGYINSTTPQIAGLLEESREAIGTGQDVLEGLTNNPLIRGGITPEMAQPATFQSYRDDAF